MSAFVLFANEAGRHCRNCLNAHMQCQNVAMHKQSGHVDTQRMQTALAAAGTHRAAPVLQLSGVTYHLPGRALCERWSLDLAAGLTLVRGGDGSGKTTLLALLAGAVPPAEGELILVGVPLSSAHEAYCRQVFRVEPRADQHEAMPVRQIFSAAQAQYPSFSATDLAELVVGFSLQEHLDKTLYMLSTGSKRKVMLAAALASGAALTLIDEPFAALDRPSIKFLHEVLIDAAQHPSRAFVIADYEAPAGIPLTACIDLD